MSEGCRSVNGWQGKGEHRLNGNGCFEGERSCYTKDKMLAHWKKQKLAPSSKCK
jgi:hypothetical protein